MVELKEFSGIEGVSRTLFVLVIAVLGVEYVQLPHGMSLYKVVIVPACTFGTILIWVRGVRIQTIWGFFPILLFALFMVFSYLKWGVGSSLRTALGLIPFYCFTYFYLTTFGWPVQASVALAVWSIPHLISLILFQLGLSNAAFSDSAFRFDGIHSDPNFMVLFVLASSSGKAVLIGLNRSHTLKVVLILLVIFDIFMIGMSGSRGGALGLLVTFFVFVVLHKGFRRTIFLFLVFGVVLNASFMIIYYNLPSSISGSPFWITIDRIIYTNKFVDLNTSSGDRLYLWENAIKLQQDKGFMVGYTIENFREKYWLYPHNTFVDAVLECGLPGLVLLLLIIIYSSKTLFRNMYFLDLGGVQAILIGVAFWGILLFISSFTTKVFWLSILLPYSMSIRFSLDRSSVGKPWRIHD